MDMLLYDKRDFNVDISRWNVSNVVDMDNTSIGVTSFNSDLSCWDAGQVGILAGTSYLAISFDRQLGGAWATSTAEKHMMFFSSPGTIAGKTKDASGTIE